MDIVRYQILLHLFQLIDQQPMAVPGIGSIHTDSILPPFYGDGAPPNNERDPAPPAAAPAAV